MHSRAFQLLLWLLLGLVLLVLARPAYTEDKGTMMYVSPKVTELRLPDRLDYVVWAAIKTAPNNRNVSFTMTIDPRVELVKGKGAMVTYNGATGSGGNCDLPDAGTLHCWAIADSQGWVGVTAYLRFIGDPATYTGHELWHDVSVDDGQAVLTDRVHIYIPHGTLGQEPTKAPVFRQYVPMGGSDGRD